MATTVNSVAPLPGGTPLINAVGISSTSPAIVVGGSSATNSITLALGNVGGVKTMNTQNGDLNMIMSDGMGIVESTGGNLLLHPYFPLTGTATTATLVAGNLNNAMAWQGGVPGSTVAYVPGAVVIYSGTTYVCLIAQPVPSVAPSNDGINWQSIGGGGTSGGSITAGGATVACDDPSASGSITLTTTAGTTGDITLDATGGTTGQIVLNGNELTFTSAGAVGFAGAGALGFTTSAGILSMTNSSTTAGDDVNITSGVSVNISANGKINFQPVANGSLAVAPSTADYNPGYVLFDAGTWDNTKGYILGSVVQEVAGGASYVCILEVAPNATAPNNPSPSTTPTSWLPLGGAGSTPTEITQAGASVAVGAGGGIIATTTGTDDYIVQTKTGTATGNILLSGNGSNSFGSANINIMNNSTTAINIATGATPFQIVGDGSTLAKDNLGSMTYTTTDVASNENKITLTTTIPTTTPGNDAGHITLNAGGSLSLSTGTTTGNLDITNPSGTIQVSLGASSYMNVDVAPGTGYAQGTIPFYNLSSIWNNTSGYGRGCIVAIGSLTAPTAFFICILTVAPAVSPAVNPAPSANPTNWLPFGGGGASSGSPMTLSTATGAVWSGALGYAVGDVVNQPSPTGVFVCIQAIPVPTPPATNPTPSSSPTFWVELLTATTTPGSAMVYTTPFNNAIAYVAQSVVPDPAGGDYVCILATTAPTAPAVNPNPSGDPTHWQQLGSATAFEGVWANVGNPPATPVLYDPQQTVVLPNLPPTGILYPDLWVSATSYLPNAKVSFAQSASVATLTNYLCIVATGASTVPPYTNTGSWIDVGVVPIVDGLYPWGGGAFVNTTASSAYPLTGGLTDFTNTGWGRQVPNAKFDTGKYVFPPLPSANIQVQWGSGDSAVPKAITGLCPYSPQFFETWLQPIRVNVAFDFEQQDATGTGATDELYLTVGLYGTNTLSLPAIDPLPAGNIISGMATTTMITQQTLTYYQGTFPGWTNISFEACVGENLTPSAPVLYKYYGLYAILEFNGGAYTITCVPDVDNYRGNAYWQFSPRLATATNNNFVNN